MCAPQVDPKLDVVKGRGGALLREKVRLPHAPDPSLRPSQGGAARADEAGRETARVPRTQHLRAPATLAF